MRRVVFYLPGFDPRSSSHYHRLYREQAKLQRPVNGLSIQVGSRKRLQPWLDHWHLDAVDPAGVSSSVDYRYLIWDDIVRKNWEQRPLVIIAAIARLARAYILSGAIFRVGRLALGPAVTGLYPAVYFIVMLALTLLTGFAAISLLADVVAGLPMGFANVANLAIWGAVILLGYRLTVRLGDRLKVFWLLRVYMFCHSLSTAKDSELEARLDLFASDIKEQLESEQVDEVLLVGHSVGSIMTIPVVSRLIALGLDSEKLVVMTLGHCVPVVSELPSAKAFRQQAQTCLSAKKLKWYDFSAVRDGACFYGVSPLYCATQKEGVQLVKQYSARFHALFTPASYKRLKRNWFQLHFQYLMATELPGLMDYYRFTASPLPVAQQFVESDQTYMNGESH